MKLWHEKAFPYISVLDDAVLKIYDDDFVLDSDPNGPIPLAKLWSHIQMLREDDDMLLKKFAVCLKIYFIPLFHILFYHMTSLLFRG